MRKPTKTINNKTMNQFLQIIKKTIHWKIYFRITFIFSAIGLLHYGCSQVEPVLSKAGVMTHPDCAKYSTEEAVATCESGLRQRGGHSRFSFGIGVTRLID